MNRYPLWKNLLVLGVLIFGLVYAAPNLFPPDPAIQISPREATETLAERTLERALEALEEKGIAVKASEFTESSALIRLQDAGEQLDAHATIEKTIGPNRFVIALNKAPTTPDWLKGIGGEPMKLGLDLDGGVYFLLEVDIDAAVQKRMESNASTIRSLLREERNRYRSVEMDESLNITATFATEELRTTARDIIGDEFSSFTYSYSEEGEEFHLMMSLNEAEIQEIKSFAINQNRVALSNRVNELGVAEANVAQQGPNRIVVELPGVQDTARAKSIIGRTANLEFRLEAESSTSRSERENFQHAEGGYYDLEKDIIFTGDNVTGAQSGFDPQTSVPEVSIELDSDGGQQLNRVTQDAVGRSMAVLFIEYLENVSYKNGERIVEREEVKEIINIATINSVLNYSFRITGLSSSTEARDLALLLRAGALAAPMYIVEERTISGSLGAKNIEDGVNSVYLGLALVLIFMLIYYRIFGFAANVALAANLILLVAWMSILGATLTLPGIAGIVLTVGMAVDANVLIFSRVREELKLGSPPHQAINSGFDRAFVTILDANITTLIVAVILFALGSGPVKGFAVTLSLGILTSMFTAIIGTRSIVNFIYGGKRSLKKLWI